MNYIDILQYIQAWIKDNNNKEITAAIMRDVLEKMLLYTRASVGEVSDLNQGSNTVEAINILFGAIENLNTNFPINVHEGNDNPNVNPPINFNAPDFYIKGGTDTYIYTGTSWVLIQSASGNTNTPSLELVVQQGNRTSRPLLGMDYFPSKNNNDFAQMQDVFNASGGLSLHGLRVVKRPSNTNASKIQLNDFAEGWVSNNLFVQGLFTGTDDTAEQLNNDDNWTNSITF